MPEAAQPMPRTCVANHGKKSPARRRWCSLATGLLAWSYLALILAIASLLWLAGDRWWPATLLTFGPRWAAIVPLPILSLLVLCFRRRAFIPLTIAGFIAIGPIMGFCFPWRELAEGAASNDQKTIRVLSYNVGGGTRIKKLSEFVLAVDPDVVVCVEWGSQRKVSAILGDGWDFRRHAGIVIASRYPIVDTKPLKSPRIERWNNPAFRCGIELPQGVVYVVGVHLETPREGLQEVLNSRWKGAAEMERTTAIRRVESELASQLAAEVPGPTLVAGDFNMPIDSTIYQQYWSDWQNAFSTVGFGFGETKFTNHFGIRIDHILANSKWRVRSAEVGPDLGGDHRPLVVTAELR